MTEPAVPPTQSLTAGLAPGTALPGDRYRIRRVLGRGGSAITYEADDLRLARVVAVKELFTAGSMRIGGVVQPPQHEVAAFADARERFLREATVLARFNHPGIVKVYEVWEGNGTAYLSMERLSGRTLHELLASRGRALSEAEVRELAARCVGALQEVHRAGVLHRDLNPANVMLTDDGRVVLIDFGLAREFIDDQTTPITRMVTPGYAPPEQYAGMGRLGPPTDVYGLAATLYRAATGRAPTAAPERQAGAWLSPPYRIDANVSRQLSDGILDGLELRSTHRPQTVEAFALRLGLSPSSSTFFVSPTATIPVQDTKNDRPEFVAPPPPPAPLPLPAKRPLWKVFGPSLVIAAAIGAAAPIAGVLLLAALVLPSTATAGDAIVFVRLRRIEERLLWRHRAVIAPYVAARFIRNVGSTLASSVPALLVTAAAVAVGLLVDNQTSDTFVLRPGGAIAAVLLVVVVFRNRVRFRAAVIGDYALALCLDADGKLTSWGTGLWVFAALIGLIGFGLRPDVWPVT